MIEMDQLERNVRAHRTLQVMVWRVRKARRRELRNPIPRHTCPGCFSAIYEGAAEQGWCCDCFPKRKHYEQDASLPAFAPRPDPLVVKRKRIHDISSEGR